MSIQNFLKLVEIQTKIASLFPFLVGLFFSWGYFGQVDVKKMALFFIAMLLFDMSVTAINNAQDYQKAKDPIYKETMNIIGQKQLSLTLVRFFIFTMVTIALGIGLYLSITTGWLFLVMGMLCCVIGIFYTYGPIPLSRMPLGEVFSGVTMGLGIPAMVVYLNTYEKRLFYLTIKQNQFIVSGKISALVALVIACLPLMLTIANIMLANNLRDLDTDIKNHRFTLVFYIGRKKGVQLFQWFMYSCYFVLLLGFFSHIFSWPSLLVFGTLPHVRQTLKKHEEELPQPISFKRSIDNFLLFNSAYLFSLFLTIYVR